MAGRIHRAALKILPSKKTTRHIVESLARWRSHLARNALPRADCRVGLQHQPVLGLESCAVAAAGSIVPSITLTKPPACASSEVLMYSIMASSCSSVRSLIGLLCSTLCSRGTCAFGLGNVDSRVDQCNCQLREPGNIAVAPLRDKHIIASLYKAVLGKCSQECFEFPLGWRRCAQMTDAPHSLGLLRTRRERPRCRAAERRDEFAPSHVLPSPIGERFSRS